MMRLAPVALALLFALGMPAAAAAVGVSVSSTSNTSTTVTLNGFDETATGSFTMTISGGTSAGWSVTAWAPALTDNSRSLGALSVPSQPSASACTGVGCVKPTPTGLSFPVTLGTSSGRAVKIYNAASHTGSGTDPVSVPYSVAVPANTLAGPYTTTITLAVANGP
jgi:hypothetical protein